MSAPGEACSVVVAVRRSEHNLDRFIAALAPQVDPGVEVILVDDGPFDQEQPGPAWTRCYHRPGALVPVLWSEGLARATGPVVALTTAGMVPDPDWLSFARRAPGDSLAGVGGAIEPAGGQRRVDWAVYFCRYSPYMLPLADGAALDVPADNATYLTAVLQRYRDLWEDGFWEPAVHRAMRADGFRLGMQADMIVRHAGGPGIREFAHQRALHGQAHGERRPLPPGRGAAARVWLTAPLVPPLMAARAARAVWSKRRHRRQFVVALPLIVWFYSWWAAGELRGRLRAANGGVRWLH